ncbi:MAG: aminotransferase class I/II-fold pyridoxal phosphate-dependent enzyme [Burkholderiaceae bacterium]|nr:aminotransferase class I/II-fold pyridoxal phosphate-dependent enzyme [Burkholderiaceae bacterium]
MIPYGRQSISEADIEAVVAVLRSDWITQGPVIDQFEQALAAYCGARHAVAVCNATAALHLACLALGVGPGRRVWTVPNTFLASANCALYCGAQVDFVDIDDATYNLDVPALAAKLRAARERDCLPDVLIAVHFAGQSCDMAGVAALAAEYGFKVIEDASHAVGADYLDGKVGNCRHSDLTVFSFHPVKILTTGEGGMVMSNRPELDKALRRLRSHGMTRERAELSCPDPEPWYYEQLELGFNYRITDIQAALGLSQLDRLDEFVARRRAIAARIRRERAHQPPREQEADGRGNEDPIGVQAEHVELCLFGVLEQQRIAHGDEHRDHGRHLIGQRQHGELLETFRQQLAEPKQQPRQGAAHFAPGTPLHRCGFLADHGARLPPHSRR